MGRNKAKALALIASAAVLALACLQLIATGVDHRQSEAEYGRIRTEAVTDAREEAGEREKAGETEEAKEAEEAGEAEGAAPRSASAGSGGSEGEACGGGSLEAEGPQAEGPSVDFEALQGVNPDIVAWIYVPVLGISYPVAQGSDNEYYLTHTVEGEKRTAASIFMDYRNSNFTDMNTVIYGHNMRNGSMFGALHGLESESVWEDVRYFLIYTPEGTYKYDIFSCFNTPDTAYDIYVTGGERYSEYVAWLKDSSAYDTGVEVSGSDRIVTLSTCTSYGNRYEYRWIVNGVYAGTVG